MKTPFRIVVIISIFLFSCSKEDPAPEILFKVDGGADEINVQEFSIQLNADLDSTQRGDWTIVSGLVDNRVHIEDKNAPNTVFHGLPGVEYQLQWKVESAGKTSRDTVVVSFAPLKTKITDKSLDYYTTSRHLEAKKYDRGQWTVLGDEYHRFQDKNLGGYVIPDNESNHVKFYGYENKSYVLVWETWYGSVSATDTLEFETGDFHQFEALEELGILGGEYYYKLDEEGNVIELNLGGDIEGNNFDRPELNPSLKALVHLKRLILSGDGLHNPPSVISTYYTQLEYLNLSGNYITQLPENFGNLTKLDTLLLDHMQGGHQMLELPESFGNLESLKYLDMSGMELEKIPESFAQLTNLEYLDLEGNRVQKLPEEFGNLKKLKTFRGPGIWSDLPESFSELESLEFCFFFLYSDAPKLPTNFGDLDNLETLWVYGDLPYLPASFTDLENIKELEFTGATDLLQELPADLGNLNTLEKLRIHGSFTSLPESIGNLTNLKSLHITGLLETLPSSLTQLANLEYLNFYAANVSSLPEEIGNLKNLRHLNLGQNELQMLPESMGNLNNLFKLDVSANDISTFPESLGNLNGVLYELYVGGNTFSEEEFQKLKEMLPHTQIYSY